MCSLTCRPPRGRYRDVHAGAEVAKVVWTRRRLRQGLPVGRRADELFLAPGRPPGVTVGMAPWRGVPVGMRASPLDSYVMRGQDKKKGFREIISSGASGSYFYVTPNRQVILPRYPIPRHNPNAGLLPTCRAVPCRAMPCFVLPVTRQSHACI